MFYIFCKGQAFFVSSFLKQKMETKKDSLFLSNILKQKPDKKSETFFVSNLIFVFVKSGQAFFILNVILYLILFTHLL